ncbi:unnamed protein product [Rotaria socialis]
MFGTLYIADSWNHHVTCWTQGAKEGTVIVGGNGQGAAANQFYYPNELVECEGANNTCNEPEHLCLNHSRCHDFPICYPVPSFNEQLCPPIIELNPGHRNVGRGTATTTTETTTTSTATTTTETTTTSTATTTTETTTTSTATTTTETTTTSTDTTTTETTTTSTATTTTETTTTSTATTTTETTTTSTATTTTETTTETTTTSTATTTTEMTTTAESTSANSTTMMSPTLETAQELGELFSHTSQFFLIIIQNRTPVVIFMLCHYMGILSVT